ncbi:MAG: LuxR C-terminal-related transcriptional regulator [Egibacteraceae bacterium]
MLIVGRGGALAEALVRLLERDGIAAASAQASEIENAVERHSPATLLLETSASLESLQKCVEAARAHCATIQVLLLGTGEDRDQMLTATLKAAGVVAADTTAEELVANVKGLRATRMADRKPKPVAGARRRSGVLGRLTVRELEILRALMAGASNAGVARQLKISIHTVRSHVQNILAKLNASTRLEAVMIGFRGGLRPLYDIGVGTVKT